MIKKILKKPLTRVFLYVRVWVLVCESKQVVFIENLILCTHLYKIVGLINTISLSIYVSQELSNKIKFNIRV